MRVNQNITAMNAYRTLTVTQGDLSKSLEKLSSGFRINRAADDAAGLAISEKLRGQVSGLNQASSNAQNGISLIQTAEGSLNETASILQRMRTLSVQSANDTNTTDDRAQIGKEVTALTDELNRISTNTSFNSQSLLDGTFTAKKLQVGANADQNISVSIGNMSASARLSFFSTLNLIPLSSLTIPNIATFTQLKDITLMPNSPNTLFASVHGLNFTSVHTNCLLAISI